FTSVIVVAKTSKTMLNSSGENGHPYFVPVHAISYLTDHCRHFTEKVIQVVISTSRKSQGIGGKYHAINNTNDPGNGYK
ncbi:hypothetical protein PSY55_23830, partial [Shigella flexneri]|nr:hypothetical protein [Shigella flexneri]